VGDFTLGNSITGDYNTALGAGAGTDPDVVSKNIYIGDAGFAGGTNVIAIAIRTVDKTSAAANAYPKAAHSQRVAAFYFISANPRCKVRRQRRRSTRDA
jgi:hypothetical protein